MLRTQIESEVKKALKDMGAGEAVFVVERPDSLQHGDFATNAALAAAKILKKSPKEAADLLKAKILSIEGVDKIEIAGAGFINFFLSRSAIKKEVETAATDNTWGNTFIYESKAIMVEYTDPNPFKEFHIGHLMSNAIGESIARLLEASGATVTRANYQGDVGLHVAKAIWGKMQNPATTWGEAYVYGAQQYETHKEEIDGINKKVYERSDTEVNALYDSGRKTSLAHFEGLYTILGTKFDFYFFESETTPIGRALVESCPNVFVESDGARVFRGEEEGLHTRVFLTSQGLPTYEAKDLGLLKLKNEKNFDTSITITASEQKEYFKVVLAAAKHITELQTIAQKTMHVSHGMMRFTEGKMSSRKGNVITGESLLKDLTNVAKEKMQERELADAEKISEQVAVGAIKYSVLKQGSGKDIIFDAEKSLSLEGDSGPYIQYAHTRALSLLRGAKEASIAADTSDMPKEASSLERLLLHFPDVVRRAAKELEPHYVTTYVTELASEFNSWYANERILAGNYPHYGVLLTQATEQTLAKGLSILGISAPEEM
ncbi:arginine--tRNA ligase [Acetobacteraceae bacterium]|nr:arginine--tRNA ligase [Candidatus Parcubacteria bacterium]